MRIDCGVLVADFGDDFTLTDDIARLERDIGVRAGNCARVDVAGCGSIPTSYVITLINPVLVSQLNAAILFEENARFALLDDAFDRCAIVIL